MLIRVIHAFCLRPFVDVYPGDVVEATPREALDAIGYGRAVEVDPEDEAETPVKAPEPTKSGRKWGRK